MCAYHHIHVCTRTYVVLVWYTGVIHLGIVQVERVPGNFDPLCLVDQKFYEIVNAGVV